ncbi:DNA-formamidopyrimidine glycosylase [Rossellomorea sp. BNER]|uniref:DNA-formamidopyrimidine glycosylase n=1 Tax=Rossellomorea sp. BNER TaxID=2962031 RepID=UPI003AF26733|nr:DNA-formamidopyrimidine glycosylase [Rossellomorea sp. BNER]
MPELPEVETVRKTLIELVKGKKIEKVSVFWPKIIKHPMEVDEFKTLLQGETIETVHRRGKFLVFYTNHFALVSHLRMEGRYGLYAPQLELEPHTHVIFTFTDGTTLRYKDVRKFGTMHLFEKGEEESYLPLSQLGPEPFSKDFTTAYLKQKLQKTERLIKAVLLDQKVVVGLGNIYVDEALFRAGILPDRKAKSLKSSEVLKLHNEIISTLNEAVRQGGSTIRSYVNSQGQIGMFQQLLYVYGKKGEACKRCGSEIEKMVTAGRGTHYCKKCQK